MTTMMKIVHVPDKSTSLEETNFSFGKIQKIDSTKNRRSKNAQLITDIYCRYQCEAKPVLTLFISFLFINTASDRRGEVSRRSTWNFHHYCYGIRRVLIMTNYRHWAFDQMLSFACEKDLF